MNIFKIFDSYLVLKGDKIIPEERVRAQNLEFKNFYEINGGIYNSFDVEKSIALGFELPINEFQLKPKEFVNQLNNTQKQVEIKKHNPNDVFFYADFTVKDEDIPPAIKQIGFKIYSECEIYKIKYDEARKQYITTDENGREEKINSYHASANSDSITMNLRMYAFSKKDYARIQQISNNPKQNLSYQDKALMAAYDFVINDVKKATKQKPYTLHHEITHLRNKNINNQFNLAQNRGLLSPENFYRLSEYDEKIAHLAENLKAIKAYCESNQPNNFEMFPEKSDWLVKKLKNTPVEKCKLLLCDNKMLVEETNKYWDKNHKNGYLLQFFNVVDSWARKSPISFMGDDNAEYNKRLSAIYSLKKYNPITKKEEITDFSRFLGNEDTITPEIQAKIIKPVNKTIAERKDKFNIFGITNSVVKYVQKLHYANNLGYKQSNQNNVSR